MSLMSHITLFDTRRLRLNLVNVVARTAAIDFGCALLIKLDPFKTTASAYLPFDDSENDRNIV